MVPNSVEHEPLTPDRIQIVVVLKKSVFEHNPGFSAASNDTGRGSSFLSRIK